MGVSGVGWVQGAVKKGVNLDFQWRWRYLYLLPDFEEPR